MLKLFSTTKWRTGLCSDEAHKMFFPLNHKSEMWPGNFRVKSEFAKNGQKFKNSTFRKPQFFVWEILGAIRLCGSLIKFEKIQKRWNDQKIRSRGPTLKKKTVKNHNLTFLRVTTFRVEKFGRSRLCRKLPTTRAFHWAQNLKLDSVVLENKKIPKNKKLGRKLLSHNFWRL